jgi:hypothetical protein
MVGVAPLRTAGRRVVMILHFGPRHISMMAQVVMSDEKR